MSAELAAAASVLVLLVCVFVCLRRGRHGGLAGGDSTAVPPPGVAEPGTGRTFSASEVARHSEPDDLWLIIGGKVYDFSDVRLKSDWRRGRRNPRVWDGGAAVD